MTSDHYVIDNVNVTLKEKLASILPSCDGLSVAVGFFFLSGFSQVARELNDLSRVRILIGGKTNAETAEALVAQHLQRERITEAMNRLKMQRYKPGQSREPMQKLRETIETMEQSPPQAEGLTIFHQLLKEGRMEVKVFPGPFLHAKAYLMHHKPEQTAAHGSGQVIVGSSNLSLHGLETSNELNLLSRHPSDYEMISKWFEERWEQGVEITPQVLTLLTHSWAIHHLLPWEFYMQILFWLNREDITDEIDPRIKGRPLFKFQREAVVQAANRLEQYHGVILADVVGLGKTFTGAALLSTVRHKWEDLGRPCSPLIVTPPRLEGMWRRFCTDFHIDAVVLSSGKLSQEHFFKSDEFRQYRRFRNLILVDESHNFRHDYTIKYRALEQLCWNKRTILLTATPMNRGPMDIYTQLRLFLPAVGHRLNLENPDLSEFFKNLPENLDTPEAGRPLVELLQQIMIRRTRRYILAHDATVGPGGRKGLKIDDKWYYFPQRELMEPLRYDIGRLYGERSIYQEISRKMKQLKMTRYGPGNYLLPKFVEKRNYAELKKGSKLLIGLMRTLLLKRFESSVEAFRKTVGRMEKGCRELAHLIESDPDSPYMPIGEEYLGLVDYIEDNHELRHRLAEVYIRVGKYHREAFYVDHFVEDLKADADTFGAIHRLVVDITPEQDVKLQRLQKLLDELGAAGEKVLLFSEFTETVEYLGRNLKFSGTMRTLYGSQGQKEIEQAVRLFAPEYNDYKLSEGERGIDLLMTTDVLSEGQNLQTGRIVINYDLHWNPVRLIQRIGRVDRIGSEHETVNVHNFLPDPELEKNLGLETVLKARIQEILNIIGEDSKTLTHEEKLNEEDMYAIYLRRDDDILDREEGAPPDLERLKRLRGWMTEDPRRERGLREAQRGLRAAKDGDGAKMAVVALEAGTLTRYYRVPSDGEPIDIPREEALNLMQSSPEAEMRKLPPDMDELVNAAREQFVRDYDDHRRRIASLRGNTREQKWVRKSIQHAIRDVDHDLLERLRGQFMQGLPLTLLRELRKLQRRKVVGKELVKQLDKLARDYILDPDPPSLEGDMVKIMGAMYLW